VVENLHFRRLCIIERVSAFVRGVKDKSLLFGMNKLHSNSIISILPVWYGTDSLMNKGKLQS